MLLQNFTASGKLLLFGEFLVLRGTKCLSIPLSVGQKLCVQQSGGSGVHWHCYDEQGKSWLEIHFADDLKIRDCSDKAQAAIVQKLLSLIKENTAHINFSGLDLKFTLDFNRQFGFGTSATLLSLLGQWSGVNPYFLSDKTFAGSGFDIAAATAKSPVIYSVANRIETPCQIPETISRHLLFVYLGKKQTSSVSVAAFRNKPTTARQLDIMNKIVTDAANCGSITEWEALMQKSETLLSQILGMTPVKELHFPDYPYAIKSLGAWGGDFVMATCRNVETAKAYFREKGKQPVFLYNELARQDLEHTNNKR